MVSPLPYVNMAIPLSHWLDLVDTQREENSSRDNLYLPLPGSAIQKRWPFLSSCIRQQNDFDSNVEYMARDTLTDQISLLCHIALRQVALLFKRERHTIRILFTQNTRVIIITFNSRTFFIPISSKAEIINKFNRNKIVHIEWFISRVSENRSLLNGIFTFFKWFAKEIFRLYSLL